MQDAATGVVMTLTFDALVDLKELEWYTEFTRNLKVTKYLEIGVDQGLTMYSVITNSPKGSLGIAVDLNDTSFINKERTFSTTKENLNTLGYDVSLIQGDSKDPKVISKVEELAPYDLILIDGDHTYEGVQSDWDNYSSMSSVVALHDACARDNPHTRDVWRFWEGLKQGRQYLEVNFSNYQLGYGVIFRG